MTIQERASRYIAKIEAISGSEGHRTTFQVAGILRNGFALSVEDSVSLMLSWNQTNAHPAWSENQIRHKVLSVDSSYSNRPPGYLLNAEEQSQIIEEVGDRPKVQKRRRWPKCDTEKVISLLRNAPVTLAEFQASSPTNTADVKCPYQIIDHLFCQGELEDPYLCLGKNVFDAQTRRRSDWEDRLDSPYWQYIVPNPMIAAVGETQTGKTSARAKSNVLERRFIVIECDFDITHHTDIFQVIKELNLTVQDVCTTVLAELSKTASLAMAVNSGGKSIHGWFPVQAASRRVQFEFFRQACSLGADPQMANTNQWTRFPLGTRDSNYTRQAVEYFDSDPFLLQF